MKNAVKLANLIDRLRADFPEFQFTESARARWSPDQATVYFGEEAATLLHELGHATLGHHDFNQDIELLKMERDAWTRAQELAAKYSVQISDSEIENVLDAYRDWLHARSLCPNCTQTGVQRAADLSYYCVNCGTNWVANDARSCGLKRRRLSETAA
jgi:ribosomal protein L37AE/L43A